MTTLNPKRSKIKIDTAKKGNGQKALNNGANNCGDPSAGGGKPSQEEILKRIVIVETDVLSRLFNGSPVLSFLRDGGIWFYANKVCGVLDIANPRDALLRLEPDEKGVGISRTAGGPQEVNIVNESGLYALIFSSRKPKAKAFRRWVTSEVLPALRKTGNYNVGTVGSEPIAFDPNEPARYVVVVVPGSPPHIRKTPVYALLNEWTALDTEILAAQIQTVDAMWQKAELIRSIGDDPAGSPMYDQLGSTIADARRLSDEYLRGLKVR